MYVCMYARINVCMHMYVDSYNPRHKRQDSKQVDQN